MKRSLLTLTLAIFAALYCMAAGSSSLIMQLKNGTKIMCSLDKEPQMAFGEKAITLSSMDGMVGQWDFTDVESWSFGSGSEDAVGKVKDAQIHIEGSKITIYHAPSTADNWQVAIYDMSGRLRTPSLTTKGNATTVSLNGLTKGTYILKVGTSSAKFIVK